MLEVFLAAFFWIMECMLFSLSPCSFCQATLPWAGGAVSQHKNRQLKNLELCAVSGIDIAKHFRITFFIKRRSFLVEAGSPEAPSSHTPETEWPSI